MARRGSHTVMVFPDWHEGVVDDRSAAARECALAIHRKLKPERTVLLGDMLECAPFSAHGKRSIGRDAEMHWLDNEVRPFQQVLKRISKNTRELVYLEGNHCARIERYCANVGGPMGGLYELLSPEMHMKQAADLTWIPYGGPGISRYEIAPDLWAIHGWSTAQQAAKKHAEIANGRSIVHGHSHRLDFYKRTVPGEDRSQTVWSPGCLAPLQPDWCASPTNWAHGVSIIHVKNDLSHWTAYTVEIENGGKCILPDGRAVRV